MSLLSLIRDAVVTELRNRFGAHQEPAPEPAPVAKVAARSPWESPTFHLEQLRSETCLCGAAKRVGSYQCLECRQAATK